MKTILVDAINTFIIENKESKYEINKNLFDLLESYDNRKIIVTNANNEQMLKFGLDKMPYEVFSLKHNPDKIDSEYFKILLTLYNLEAKDIIYFEHNKDAVESASSLGIISFYYYKEKRDLISLKEFLDKNI